MRLIDADALKKQYIETDKWGKVILILDIVNAPTIDAEPVKHGEWINKRLTKDSIKDIKDGTYGELIGYHDVCSICGFDLDKYWYGYKPPYCPNCGAKMDKE